LEGLKPTPHGIAQHDPAPDGMMPPMVLLEPTPPPAAAAEVALDARSASGSLRAVWVIAPSQSSLVMAPVLL